MLILFSIDNYIVQIKKKKYKNQKQNPLLKNKIYLVLFYSSKKKQSCTEDDGENRELREIQKTMSELVSPLLAAGYSLALF